MMTDELSTTPATPAADVPERATLGRVLRDQRKTLWVAGALALFGLWFGQYGNWTLAGCIAGGVLLGLVNLIHTEYWLLRIITSGAEPTRGQMTRATIVRLTVLAIVAIGIAVAFWPAGIGLLLGLAIFRLISLVMTAIPLLKELKNQ
ncbi:hypothetical protein [Nocardioides marmorisolisilvae]|uniref:ATP synthase subunit I n=1 Tax=Nocardioides marmorisolisilvae TaxID=1542737 RepID=A0A3N0DX45_9ACTN|nr:hypothetical protein [Nocardioides marmorisolisilvae]RNL80023.1 hypothetical protein EFL95_13980 [Nocardioides marmorisolisilvae]